MTIGVAVVGVGAMGTVHAQNLADGIPNARLRWVVEQSEAVGRTTAERLNVRHTADVDQALEDRAVDAIMIATPPSTHAALVMRAAASGKAIFCEKPLAHDAEHARDASAAVRAAGVVLQVGFHRRFDPDYALLKERIDAGELGDVRMFFSSMRDPEPPPDATIRGGEDTLLRDSACHDFDAARWLVGEVSEVTTHGAVFSSPAFTETGQIDSAVIALRFTNGALGCVDQTLAGGYGFECRTEVLGSRGAACVHHPQLRHVQWMVNGEVRRDQTMSFLERFSRAYPAELRHFIDCIRFDRAPLVGGEDGVAAAILCDAALRSQREGRTVALAASPERP